MTSYEITNLRIGLREIIINAIEHGNLGISYEEKSGITGKSDYIDYIAKKQNEAPFSSKKVIIRMQLLPKKVVFEVEDEGNGFDHRKISASIRNNRIQTDENRGKGITMAYGIFDEISYNEKGNKVTLTKLINSSTR